MPIVLFVCDANLCRSVIASTVMRDELARRRAKSTWMVESVGLRAVDGMSPPEDTIRAMHDFGYDLSGHRSACLNRTHVQTADLVLAMTRNQKQYLQHRFPDQAHKVLLLSEMVGQHYDVNDPCDQTLSEHRNTAAEIIHLVHETYDNILAHALANGGETESGRVSE